jgi:predicted hotdog family 3-hydroxylacyl-ACP dehydratase
MSELSIAGLVPHSGRMLLLDAVLDAGAETLCAQVTIRPDSMFCGVEGVASWVGIEYMAQAVAAHAGYLEREKNEPARIGFLLGSRRYETACAAFAVGSVLRVEVQRLLVAENGLGSYDCRILQDDATLASARLNVFQPNDIKEFMKGMEHE